MIVRGNRSTSRIKSDQHQLLQLRIQELQHENRQLRVDALKMEQRLIEAQTGKKKYKNKYREAKQKIQILGLVGLYHKPTPPTHANNNTDSYDCCLSPRTKTTRIQTASEQEFHSLKAAFTQSELEDIPTKHYLPDADDYYHIQPQIRKTTSNSRNRQENNKEDPKILQNLMKLHEQLEKLSAQIELKNNPTPALLSLEGDLYRKLDQVVDKLTQMEVRELQREQNRVEKEKERNAKRYSNSLKAVQKIGKDLLYFKVDD